MENFSQPMMQPSDFHSSHSSRNIIITVIVVVASIFILWRYKDSIFNSATVSGLDPQKKAVLEAVISGKGQFDQSVLQKTIGQSTKGTQLTNEQKVKVWQGLISSQIK